MAKQRELSVMEIGIIAKELQALIGGRLQKVYQPDDKEFIFDFHVPGQGKRLLKVMFPTLIFLTQQKPAQEEPPMFCQRLRKLLLGAMVQKVEQHGFERIIVIELDAHALIFELFGTGNLVVAKNGLIELIMEARVWKERILKMGEAYRFPVCKDIPSLSFEAFSSLLKEQDFDSVVKWFAIGLSLGGKFAEELCGRAGIDKTAKTLNVEDAQRCFSELKAMLSSPVEPVITEDGDIAPFRLKEHEGKQLTAVASFSEAVEKLSLRRHHRPAPGDRERDRLLTIISQQQGQLARIEHEIAENTRKGELIYEHYQLVKGLLDEVHSLPKEEMKQRLATHEFIKAFDLKAKTIIIEL
ncbi:MAG: NFACT family protein [Nanoarchaeota archaeon]